MFCDCVLGMIHWNRYTQIFSSSTSQKLAQATNKTRQVTLTLIGKFPWHEIYGKLIQPKLMGTYSVLLKFGVSARPISGKLIQNRAFSRIMIFKEFRAWHRPISRKLIHIWASFPEIGLAHASIFYKNWRLIKNDGWIFKESVQLILRKFKFRKNTGWIFQKSVCVTPQKTEILEKFLDDFSRICQ